MGRSGHLRRGCSLEVIFEEDSDFCSQLDSLDSTCVRFGGVKESDNLSVDSLLATDTVHNSLRFNSCSEAEQAFRSLDGLLDNKCRKMDCYVEFEEFSPESTGLRSIQIPGTNQCLRSTRVEDRDVEIPPNGRRSRVSRRQIVEASWIDDDDENALDRIPSASIAEATALPIPDSSFLLDCSFGSDTCSTLSDNESDTTIELEPKTTGDKNNGSSSLNIGEPTQFRLNLEDTLDSYISTMTDQTETNVYAFADIDSYDDITSVASTNFESSSSSSGGSVCTVNLAPEKNLKELSTQQSSTTDCSRNQPTNGPVIVQAEKKVVPSSGTKENEKKHGTQVTRSHIEDTEICTDVKKVRALFERNTNSDNSTTTSGGVCEKQKIFLKKKANLNESSLLKLGSSSSSSNVFRKSSQDQEELATQTHQNYFPTHQSQGKCSTFSLQQQNGMSQSKLDFGDLLVNDKVVIEESPDVFQTRKKIRGQQKVGHSGTMQTLRRSKSVGTGISNLADDYCVSASTPVSNNKSNGCILAEELPPPDTVKNVRTVFEKLMAQFSNKTSTISGKKSLVRSIKSNPTSKIFRSESMRDDFPVIGTNLLRTNNRPYGKPILMPEDTPMVTTPKTEPPKMAQVLSIDRQVYQPMARERTTNKNVDKKINEKISHREKEEEEDSGTILSSATEDYDDDDDEEDEENEKIVSPDVLQRIRSCGTTTTYFGGHVVAKTVKNRKLPVEHVSSSGRSSSTSTTDEGYYRDSSSPALLLASSTTTSDGHEESTASDNDDGPKGAPNNESQLRPHHHHLFMPLDPIFTATSGLDTTPRIIEVLPKSQSSSPAKSGSPAGSVIIEGRNSPEGCESGVKNERDWVACEEEKTTKSSTGRKDGNNNSLVCLATGVGRKFSESSKGVWF